MCLRLLPSQRQRWDQTPDSKKEEYRRYLEKSGAINSLTSVLVGLYEEADRPLESTEYIKKYLGAVTSAIANAGAPHASAAHGSTHGGGVVGTAANALTAEPPPSNVDSEKVRRENEDLKTKVSELNRTIETLRANLKHARAEAKKAGLAAKEAQLMGKHG